MWRLLASTSWSSPGHITINLVASAVLVAALVDVLRTPRRRWYDRRGQVLLVLSLVGFTFDVRGVYVPVVALLWFGWWRSRGGWGLLPRGESRPLTE